MEASAFTPEQQRMLEDFVDVRGGGLLVLGGPRSFSEGGWAGTPLADALPVVLDRGSRGPQYPPAELVVKPDADGRDASVDADHRTGEADAAAKWRDLPPLTSLNPLRETKPGANVLLTGADERGREQVVLAAQRYGRGKTLALPVQDTWLWRMHARMDVKDPTFHNFWQRLARWLVDGVPDRVLVTPTPARVQKGEPVTLTAEVLDPEYKGINDGRITRAVTSPSGKIEDVPMEWTVEHDGEYRARFTPAEDGLYKLSVGGTTARRRGRRPRHGVAARGAERREYFDAAMRAPLLRAPGGRNRRPLLPREGRVAAARRDHVQRQGHHGGRRARTVGHADHAAAAAGFDGRRVAVSPPARVGVNGGSMQRGRLILVVGTAILCRRWWPAPPRPSRSGRARGAPSAAVLLRQRPLRRQVRVRPHELSRGAAAAARPGRTTTRSARSTS